MALLNSESALLNTLALGSQTPLKRIRLVAHCECSALPSTSTIRVTRHPLLARGIGESACAVRIRARRRLAADAQCTLQSAAVLRKWTPVRLTGRAECVATTQSRLRVYRGLKARGTGSSVGDATLNSWHLLRIAAHGTATAVGHARQHARQALTADAIASAQGTATLRRSIRISGETTGQCVTAATIHRRNSDYAPSERTFALHFIDRVFYIGRND